jgi:hypothetical protein
VNCECLADFVEHIFFKNLELIFVAYIHSVLLPELRVSERDTRSFQKHGSHYVFLCWQLH